MGVNFSCSAAGEATNNQYQNNNNGFREFYREYTHIHRHGARLQQLDVAAHRLWRMLSPEDRQSYARREVRRMTSRASVASSRSSNVSFGSIYSEPSSSDSVIHRSESITYLVSPEQQEKIANIPKNIGRRQQVLYSS